MEEKTLIYVAGNPDAYPLEYFDKDTQNYAGVIPELLAEFSDQSTYEIVYYEADGTDHREELAKQKRLTCFLAMKQGRNCRKIPASLRFFPEKMPIPSTLRRPLPTPFSRTCGLIWNRCLLRK